MRWQVGYLMYHELVMAATTVIDQYAGQEGPRVRLQIQFCAATQAP
jgi:hypothetical protein